MTHSVVIVNTSTEPGDVVEIRGQYLRPGQQSGTLALGYLHGKTVTARAEIETLPETSERICLETTVRTRCRKIRIARKS